MRTGTQVSAHRNNSTVIQPGITLIDAKTFVLMLRLYIKIASGIILRY